MLSLFSLLLPSLMARTQTHIVVDFVNKRILNGKNIHKRVPPASLSKKMTLLLLFDALKQKKITFNTRFTASRYAASKPACKLGIKPGQSISVRDIICGMICHSCNDLAIVAAEGLCKTEQKFVTLMNLRAKKLGMNNTFFCNPHGLPESDFQVSSAFDMALLANALFTQHPEYAHLLSLKTFKYGKRTYANHNKLLHHGCCGTKTGYTAKAGYNISISKVVTNRKGKKYRIYAIVMGESCKHARNRKALQLISQSSSSHMLPK